MAAHSGPKIPYSDVVSLVSVDSSKSYKKEDFERNHTLSKWYVTRNATINYAILDDGVSIFSEDMSEVVTELVTSGTGVRSGTLSVSQGTYIYGVNGPAYFYRTGENSTLLPITLAGNIFWTEITRYTPLDLFIFSPFEDAIVEVFFNSGIDGTPSTTLNIQKNEVNYRYTAASTGNYHFKSNVPVIIGRGTGGDQAIMRPMALAEYVYSRATENNTVSIYQAPAISSTYYVKDDTYPAMTQEVADGAGGDMCLGLSEKNLSNFYAIPNGITSYFIIAPNTNTVAVDYWNGSSWVSYNTHSFTGTASSPGTASVGSQSGSGAVLAGAGDSIWRFEGADIFYVLINDLPDDEETLLGNMKNADYDIAKNSNSLRAPSVLRDLSRKSKKFVYPTRTSILARDSINLTNPGVLTLSHDDTVSFSNNFSISIWANFSSFASNSANNGFPTLFAKGEQSFRCFYDIASNNLVFRLTSGQDVILNNFSSIVSTNEWHNYVFVKSSTGGASIYIDGVLQKNEAFNGNIATNTTDWAIGDWSTTNLLRQFQGNINRFTLYKVPLSNNRVVNLYHVFKRRYE